MLLKKCKKKLKVDVGDIAPDFTLPDKAGGPVRLSDFRGKKAVVLYFYPKDNTRYCIVESMTFRDNYEDFKDAGAEVVGVSSDSSDSHVQFANQYQLPFTLLSDVKNQVRKLYGVPATFGIIPGRVTFVIDKAGVVRHVFNAPFDPKSHVTQAFETLKKIAAEPGA